MSVIIRVWRWTNRRQRWLWKTTHDKATSTWDRDTAPETHKPTKEIERRITAGWTAFAKHRDVFKSNIRTCLKRQVYNPCVPTAMTYGQFDNHHPSKRRTNKDGKEYVKHHIHNNKDLSKKKDNGHICHWTSQKTEVDLGSARQQDTR